MPRWLRDIFASPEGGTVSDRSRGLATYDRVYPTKVWNAIVKNVCAGCNNGWMADLEHHAKPILYPMIIGETARLSVADQATLTVWAVKTALVFQARNPGTAATTVGSRRAFSGTLHPLPPTTRVFIAAFQEPAGKVVCAAWHAIGRSTVQPGPLDSYTTTLLLGRCVLQVVQSHPEHPVARVTDWDSYVQALLPPQPQTLDWPATARLQINDLQDFAMSGFISIGGTERLPPITLT